MSLRARVIAAVSVIALTLVAAMVFLTRTTESNLTNQVDDELAGAVRPVRALGYGHGDPALQPPADPPEPPPEDDVGPRLSAVFVGVVDGDQVVTVAKPGLGEEDLALPDIDPTDAVQAASTGQPITVSADGSDLRWRVSAIDSGDGLVTVIAMPLDSVDSAIDDLVTLEIIVGAIIFGALALVAFWVIRLGVSPIQKMTHTATAIAEGDLTRRVPESGPGTEVGELGDALNKMLASIEESFSERDRAEGRLRQFVADASHELRTPVATIRGYAELYRSGGLEDPEQLDDAMERTEAEAVRMGGLVEDLLSLARLDEGRPLELAAVDLARVAVDAANDARAVDPDRSIEAVVSEPVVVQADEQRIRQVVANLVGNALVHTPTDTQVWIRSYTGPDGPCIEVADDGPGMPPEVATRAFERFYRADPARSRHAGGSGLGLAIVDAVVRAHGGSVSLSSTVGEGTTVRLLLPADVPESG